MERKLVGERIGVGSGFTVIMVLSIRLLNKRAAVIEIMMIMQSEPLHLSGIEDDSVMSGELLMVRELCTVRRTLRAARAVREKLVAEENLSGDCMEMYYLVLVLKVLLTG